MGRGTRDADLTTEIFTIPLEDGAHLVYAPLRGTAFVADSPAVNALADIIGDGVESAPPDFVAFLRELEIVGAGPEPRPPASRFEGEPEPTTVTLFLTTACNLRCTYCYAAAGDTTTKNMTLATARRGIDFVLANALRLGRPAIEVNYHGGGEPTVNWRVMTGSLAYAKAQASEAGLNVTAAAASNGVLTDDQIDWVVEHLNGGVSLSFDGLPEAHDQHRVTIKGLGSSERVMHTLRRFDEAGYQYAIRVTVTADQIARLPDSVEFICRSFRPARIQVEPAYQMGRWRDAPSAETTAFIDAYREAQRRANTYGRAIGYSAARVGAITNHFCGVTQDNFTLSADGNVSACFESFSEETEFADVFFYGKPDDDGGYRFDLGVLDSLRGQDLGHRPFCSGCFAKYNCAGDCYHKSLTANGPGEFTGSERCHVTRELVKDEVLARIGASGGIAWRQTPHGATCPSGSYVQETR